MVAGREVKFPSGEVKNIENCHNDVGQHHKYRMSKNNEYGIYLSH